MQVGNQGIQLLKCLEEVLTFARNRLHDVSEHFFITALWPFSIKSGSTRVLLRLVSPLSDSES